MKKGIRLSAASIVVSLLLSGLSYAAPAPEEYYEDRSVYHASSRYETGSSFPQIWIDSALAYGYEANRLTPENQNPEYRKLKFILDAEHNPEDEAALEKLLLVGEPFNEEGLREKYGLSTSETYYLTQLALWTLLGQYGREESLALMTSQDQKEYYKELLSISQQEQSKDKTVHFSPEDIYFRFKDGQYVSQAIHTSSEVGGQIHFLKLPEGLTAYDQNGNQIDAITIGQPFFLHSTQKVEEGSSILLTYSHPVPIVYFYEWVQGTGERAVLGKQYQSLLQAELVSQLETITLTVREQPLDASPRSSNPKDPDDESTPITQQTPVNPYTGRENTTVLAWITMLLLLSSSIMFIQRKSK